MRIKRVFIRQDRTGQKEERRGEEKRSRKGDRRGGKGREVRETDSSHQNEIEERRIARANPQVNDIIPLAPTIARWEGKREREREEEGGRARGCRYQSKHPRRKYNESTRASRFKSSKVCCANPNAINRTHFIELRSKQKIFSLPQVRGKVIRGQKTKDK